MAETHNTKTNSINNTVASILMHLQKNYSQLMPQELLQREVIVKKMIYNPRDPITTVLSSVEELLEFADIMGTSYTQFQAINITYVILNRAGRFGLAICEWNCMPEVQKTWVRF